MFSQEFIQSFVEGLVGFAADLLLPFMVGVFFLGMVMRFLIHHTVKREFWFTKEFTKRVDKFLEDSQEGNNLSFFSTAKKLMEKTYYELFEVRAIMMRRRPDYVSSLTDRIFLIQTGTAKMVKDTLKQVRHLKFGGEKPQFLKISRHVLETNPCFNKVFGVIPASAINDLLNILPGIFIISGIFGTFLGITKALPDLGGIDLNDIEGSKAIMDGFLLKVAFAMSTSIVGIILSVTTNIFNTIFSPEKVFSRVVDRYENTLYSIWNRCDNNDIPENEHEFDENRDPIEALAEQAVKKQVDKLDKKEKADIAS